MPDTRILCFARGSGASPGTAPRGVAHSAKHIPRGERLNQQFPSPWHLKRLTFALAFALIVPLPAQARIHQLAWLSDYAVATRLAQQSGKKLLIWIGKPKDQVARDLWKKVNKDPRFARAMSRFVFARVAAKPLLGHVSLKAMLGKHGVAIIDWSQRCSANYGHVVSVFPFRRKVPPTHQDLHLLLKLPNGSLTQRTLIFAVRKHIEKPQSTTGSCSPMLLREAEKHSQHQAEILSQGHHNWERRFPEITNRLPKKQNLVAQEVCAESWPGEKLLEAAEECVHSWRQSNGHWRAVSGRHSFYGYDMKRGKNGIWYATGILGTKP